MCCALGENGEGRNRRCTFTSSGHDRVELGSFRVCRLALRVQHSIA